MNPHVDLVREQIEAYAAGDVARALSYFDEHLIWDGSRTGGASTGNVTYGPQGLSEFVSHYRGSFASYSYDIERLANLGGGSILTVIHEVAVGKASGARVDRRFAAVYTVMDRKIVRITLFPDERAAREAVGLTLGPGSL